MSYDLMVFETANAPKNKKDFMQWYAQQTEWGEDHDHASIEVASPALQNWFMEMKETFPPMNGGALDGLLHRPRGDLYGICLVTGGGSLRTDPRSGAEIWRWFL